MEDAFLCAQHDLAYSSQESNLHQLQLTLLSSINQNPGIRYRELLRLTNSNNGTLSYHLSRLERTNQIRVTRKKNFTRYYPSSMSQEVSNIIGFLRVPISRQIISLLVNNYDGCTFDNFASSIMRVPSTIYWHLQRLIDAGIVKKGFTHYSDDTNRSSRLFYLSEREIVKDTLSKYVESPLDKLINDYSDLIDELG